jgi:orotate phosphoribosyltransferase
MREWGSQSEGAAIESWQQHSVEIVEMSPPMDKRTEIRERALVDLQQLEVLIRGGHFDYGNGFHGRVYLNPHQLFRHPSTIWRFAQDLIDLLPSDLVQSTEVVAGPVTGGALLAHTIAGLLDSRRSLTHPPCSFAPFNYDAEGGFTLRPFYRRELKGKRVLLADDVRNTGETFGKCAALVQAAGGTVLASVEIYDRQEACVHLAVPNIALAEYRASENYTVRDCPMCREGKPITRF